MQTARRLLILAAVVIGACTTPSPTVNVSNARPVEGKTVAPIDLQAELKQSEALVTLRLEDDASELEFTAWGLDGLVVRASTTTFKPKVSKRGEHQTFAIPLTPGPGRSTLAISVSGTFRGSRLQRVATFAIGEAPPPKGEAVIITDQGEVLKDRRVQPAQPPVEPPIKTKTE